MSRISLKNKILKKKGSLLLLMALFLFLTGCTSSLENEEGLTSEDSLLESREELEENQVEEELETKEEEAQDLKLDEDGEYTDKESVALYLYQYGKLPKNYIRKKDAKDLGWIAKEGNLFEVTDGKSIGGDYFGNREGKLPDKKDRKYYECDIDYQGGRRGPKRIVYSNDGLIYYTEDHYQSFELLYGDE